MGLITFLHNGQEQIGVRNDDRVIPVASLPPAFEDSIVSLLRHRQLDELASSLQQYDGPEIPLGELQYLPLLPRAVPKRQPIQRYFSVRQRNWLPTRRRSFDLNAQTNWISKANLHS